MKHSVVAAVGLATAWLAEPASASTRDDVLYSISRCGGIADDRTWLDCVYGAAQPMRAQLGLIPAPTAQQKLVPLAPGGAPPPSQAFTAPPPPPTGLPGFLTRLVTHTQEKPEPPTILKSYKFDGAGLFTVALANGEIWRQDIGDSVRARWTKPAKAYEAQILPSSSTYHLLKVGAEIFMVNKG